MLIDTHPNEDFYVCLPPHCYTINCRITMLKSISEIAPYAPFGKSKTTQLLKEMGKKGVVKIEGRGRGAKYVIK